jgi:hypothetical protein
MLVSAVIDDVISGGLEDEELRHRLQWLEGNREVPQITYLEGDPPVVTSIHLAVRAGCSDEQPS